MARRTLGCDGFVSVIAEVQLLLQHSNSDDRIGRLRHLLAHNEGHRALRTFSFDRERRFHSDDLGMAAKPNYPLDYLVQLAEPFRASGACHFDDAREDVSVTT